MLLYCDFTSVNLVGLVSRVRAKGSSVITYCYSYRWRPLLPVSFRKEWVGLLLFANIRKMSYQLSKFVVFVCPLFICVQMHRCANFDTVMQHYLLSKLIDVSKIGVSPGASAYWLTNGHIWHRYKWCTTCGSLGDSHAVWSEGPVRNAQVVIQCSFSSS